jgi:plasmid stabilization system protein ParE
MSLPIILSPSARAEFDAAADWYEDEASLGAKFVASVQEALDRIEQMPELHPVIYKQVRRCRVTQFPYNIFYRILPDRIEVIALLHARRNPSVWKGRA